MSIDVPDAELASDVAAPGDAELVERFLVARDQAAFAELVRRHSTVVLGVCRRVLQDSNDIEDVFQATFLVLVRNAARVRKRQSLASWLYGIAYRISLRVVRSKLRRRETRLVDYTSIDYDALGRLTHRHDLELVDIELNSLPERYRQPLVLKYLSGHSTEQIAAELGTTVGAVEGLLKRGKAELRRRLMQRGITLGAALLAIQAAQQMTHGAGTQSLIDSATQAGLAWDTRTRTMLQDEVSNQAVKLAAKETIAMASTTKTAIAVGLTLGGLIIGLGGACVDLGQGAAEAEASAVNSTLTVTERAQQALDLATLLGDEPFASEKAESANPPVAARNTRSLNVLAAAMDADNSQSNKANPALVKLDLTKRGPNAAKIEAALKEPTEVAFQDFTLIEAMRFLKNRHQIDIVIDGKTLQEAGIATDQKNINLVASGIELKRVFVLLLTPFKLDYLIEDSVLTITTREKADNTLETRVYNAGLFREYTAAELMEIILLTVNPESWDVQRSFVEQNSQLKNGAGEKQSNDKFSANNDEPRLNEGTDSLPGVIRASEKLLIVRHRQRVHDEIAELLTQLR